ncbi:MAG: phosphotransferase [Myxococcota bacterium]
MSDPVPPPSPRPPQPWSAERVVERAQAEAIARRFVPAATLERIGAGWDNTAWLVDGAYVFRFPRRRIAVPLLEHEVAYLGPLAARLPLPVTAPVFHGRDDDGWPFAAYPFIPGHVLALDERAPSPEAAATLGAFVRALHESPAPAGLGGDTLGKVDVVRRLDITRALGARYGVEVPEDIVDLALSVPHLGRPQVVVHGDLDARHVLVDDAGNPTGVIDWGDLHRGDPATDLALCFSALDGMARDAFLEAYGLVWDGLPTLALARFRAIHVALAVLDWATDLGDDKMASAARAALGRSVKYA